MGRLRNDHIKRLITLTSDNTKRLSLYLNPSISTVEEQRDNFRSWSLSRVNATKTEAARITV